MHSKCKNHSFFTHYHRVTFTYCPSLLFSHLHLYTPTDCHLQASTVVHLHELVKSLMPQPLTLIALSHTLLPSYNCHMSVSLTLTHPKTSHSASLLPQLYIPGKLHTHSFTLTHSRTSHSSLHHSHTPKFPEKFEQKHDNPQCPSPRHYCYSPVVPMLARCFDVVSPPSTAPLCLSGGSS